MGWPGWIGLINLEAFLGTLGWYALSVVLLALLPAYEVDGVELKSGGRLKYRFNGVDSRYWLIQHLTNLKSQPSFLLSPS